MRRALLLIALAAMAGDLPAVRVGGGVRQGGGVYTPLSLEIDAAAVCHEIQKAAGVETDPMGAAFAPGGAMTASCWDNQLNRR